MHSGDNYAADCCLYTQTRWGRPLSLTVTDALYGV